MTCVELQESLAEIERGRSREQIAHLKACAACADLVTDLDLIIATHGRSIWTLDVSGLEGLSAEKLSQDVVLTHPQDVVRIGEYSPQAWDGDHVFYAPNSQPGTRIHELALAEHDPVYALEALVDALGARKAAAPLPRLERPARPTGAITLEKLGALLGAALPENAIVIDESITTGRAT